MDRQLPGSPRTDYIRNFDLLIKKIAPGLTYTTVDFLILLDNLIVEVKHSGARNLIIAASHASPIFENKIKTWILQYILPQMYNSGIKRIAFVMQGKTTGLEEIIHIPIKGFEVGIFSSLSGATAWIMNLSLAPGQARTCDTLNSKRCPEIS